MPSIDWHAGPTRQITAGPTVPVRLPGKSRQTAGPTRQITAGPTVPVRLPGKCPANRRTYPANARQTAGPTRQITAGPTVPVRLPGKCAQCTEAPKLNTGPMVDLPVSRS